MRMSPIRFIAAFALIAACSGGDRHDSAPPMPTFAAPPVPLRLQPVATGLDAPVFLTAPPADPRLFVVERGGRVRLIKDGVLAATPVLDISARVSTDGERGLFSLAFDPQFATNGYFVVNFTDPSGDVALERFQMSPAHADVADAASALRLLTITHRAFSNHNGGRVAFGPDGFLYFSVGDGGGAGDPFAAGQDLNTLLAKLLRIDLSNASAAQPYTVPPTNPFFNQPNRRPEIWAYGLRNPWRFAFDAAAPLVYIADVGQGQREEIDVASANAAGLNYGWSVMEGSLCFNANPCVTSGLVLPAVEYDTHASGNCAVIGGFVYRGTAIPQLQGSYFYSDLCGGWLRSFRHNGAQVSDQVDWALSTGGTYSFGEDAQGEIYVLSVTNTIYKIVRQ
jgi:glucose/arabinose dehydrogenase